MLETYHYSLSNVGIGIFTVNALHEADFLDAIRFS